MKMCLFIWQNPSQRSSQPNADRKAAVNHRWVSRQTAHLFVFMFNLNSWNQTLLAESHGVWRGQDWVLQGIWSQREVFYSSASSLLSEVWIVSLWRGKSVVLLIPDALLSSWSAITISTMSSWMLFRGGRRMARLHFLLLLLFLRRRWWMWCCSMRIELLLQQSLTNCELQMFHCFQKDLWSTQDLLFFFSFKFNFLWFFGPSVWLQLVRNTSRGGRRPTCTSWEQSSSWWGDGDVVVFWILRSALPLQSFLCCCLFFLTHMVAAQCTAKTEPLERSQKFWHYFQIFYKKRRPKMLVLPENIILLQNSSHWEMFK